MSDQSESKNRAKFVELAEKRVSRAIKDIRLVGNLSNRSNYTYTSDEAKKIVKALREEVDALKARFDAKGDNSKTVFKL
jgi:ABC-type Fe3+-hydroxamate transport system substrate-binding protein